MADPTEKQIDDAVGLVRLYTANCADKPYNDNELAARLTAEFWIDPPGQFDCHALASEVWSMSSASMVGSAVDYSMDGVQISASANFAQAQAMARFHAARSFAQSSAVYSPQQLEDIAQASSA